MAEITITSTTGDSVDISVYERTYPQESDRWDGNWLNAKIKIKAGNFSGTTNALLRSDELEKLSKDIKRFLLKNIHKEHRDHVKRFLLKKMDTLVFSPMEPWICFQMTGNKRGHIELTGEITDRLGTGNVLKYQFELSRPDLEVILKKVDVILQEFPII